MFESYKWYAKEFSKRLPPFRNTLRFIKDSEKWDPDVIQRFQQEKLKTLVLQACRYSPFYESLLKERLGCKLQEGKIEDINVEHLPLLSREMIRDNYEALRMSKIPKFMTKKLSTSGTSTGIPLIFYEDFKAIPMEHAFITDLWRRIGYQRGERMAKLRGNIVAKHTGGCPWARFGNYLLLSSYHLTERFIDDLFGALKRFRPQWLHVYPSTLYAFCQLSSRDRCRDLRIKGILTSSEKLYSWQRDLFEDYFQARVMHWYGMVEKVVLAGECERSHKLHIYPQYGYFETIPIGGGLAKVVGTSFLNSATPFIRYEVGDIARLSRETYCTKCNRPYPLIEEISGRDQEFVVTKEGLVLPFAEAVGSIHTGMWKNIKKWQAIQEKAGKILFRAQMDSKLRGNKINDITSEFKQRFGDTLDIDVEVQDTFQISNEGKFRYFVQKLNLEEYRKV